MTLYDEVKEQFPMLKVKMGDKRLVYLDTAATALKPQRVIDAVQNYYANSTCNVHRSIHTLGEKTTIEYEGSRDVIQKFINAKAREEIIFTKGTTDGLNLLSHSLSELVLDKGDEILISSLEHHSNIVPWQLSAKRHGASLKVIPIDDECNLLLDSLESLITEKTKIVSLLGISNSTGQINPIREVIAKVRALSDAKIIIDAAQMVTSIEIDVQELDCDFLVFSGHKIFGPTGVGVLYGKQALLEKMPPFQGGGDMIDQVSFEETTYNDLPYKFEAGTPAIASVIGLKDAINFTSEIGVKRIHDYTHELVGYLDQKLSEISGLKMIGNRNNKTSITSFVIDGVHNQDLASLISMDGIAIRTGHHCTQPLWKRLNITSTARASLSLYNSKEDVDLFITSLIKSKDMLS